MARVNDLTGSRVQERKRQVRTYGTKTDLSSTTVDRGDTHWMNSSRVSIDGVLDVTGLTTISGTLNVSGTTTLSGSTTIAGPTGITGALTIAGSMSVTGPSTFAGTLGINGATTITGKLDVTGPTTIAGTLGITGPLTVTGVTKLNGKTDIGGDTAITGKLDVTGPMSTKGTLSVEGVTTLKNNLTVDPSKRIILGGLVLENVGTGSAQVQMPGGGLSSSGLGMLLTHNDVMIAGQLSAIIESPTIRLNATNTYVSNRMTVTGRMITQERVVMQNVPTGAAGTPANVHIDSNGFLWKANP